MSEWELFNHSCYNLFLCKGETWIAPRLQGNPGSTHTSYCAAAGESHRPIGTCRDDTVLVKGINTVRKVRKIVTFFMVHTCFKCDLCLKETAGFYCTKETLNIVTKFRCALLQTQLPDVEQIKALYQ